MEDFTYFASLNPQTQTLCVIESLDHLGCILDSQSLPRFFRWIIAEFPNLVETKRIANGMIFYYGDPALIEKLQSGTLAQYYAENVLEKALEASKTEASCIYEATEKDWNKPVEDVVQEVLDSLEALQEDWENNPEEQAFPPEGDTAEPLTVPKALQNNYPHMICSFNTETLIISMTSKFAEFLNKNKLVGEFLAFLKKREDVLLNYGIDTINYYSVHEDFDEVDLEILIKQYIGLIGSIY